jgi:molecular chaperone GrpE
MSGKNSNFPPGSGLPDPPDFDDDLYTGQPDLSGMGHEAPDASPSGQGKGRNKGHAAYAAQEDLPPFTPRGKGFGSLGGLFTAESPGFAGKAAGQTVTGEDSLSFVPDDVLSAECRKRICPTCPAKKEADDALLRALADLDNSKKRLAREREEQVRFAAESVLADILPSLDNLDLALLHAGADPASLAVGVQMTRKLLLDALAKNGLHQTGAVGEEFNPAIHEAVGTVNSPDAPDGHVCSLLASGYTLHDRLLRPARVMVCKKEI